MPGCIVSSFCDISAHTRFCILAPSSLKTNGDGLQATLACARGKSLISQASLLVDKAIAEVLAM